MAKSLFDPYTLGPNHLKNRIVMAPLTRSRAGKYDAPGEMNAEYYAQRATAGLIISEATQVSQQSQGYLWTPGIYTAEQVEGWKKVVKAVHAYGGKLFLQMWHVGRISHTSLQPNGAAPISSTDKAAENSFAFAYDEAGNPANVPVSKPRVATIQELQQVVADYGHCAHNAQQAGFDGVEIHGGNGYLFDQFLNSEVNERTDDYGRQTKETRTRLLLEAFDAVAAVLGPDRVGVRLAPYGKFGGMKPDPKVEETFFHLAQELSRRRAAYIHIVRCSPYDSAPVVPESFFHKFRAAFAGGVIITGGLDRHKADDLLQDGLADLLGFGTLYVANPNLVERFQNNWPLNQADQSTLHTKGPKGCTDSASYNDQTSHCEAPAPLDVH